MRSHAGRNDLVQLGIDVGDIVAIDPQPEFLENGFIVSRHLDDKAGSPSCLRRSRHAAREGGNAGRYLLALHHRRGSGCGRVSGNRPGNRLLVAIDNGTTAPGQNSDEFGVTLRWRTRRDLSDYHLSKKLYELCGEHGIRVQKDVFRYYRSDAASAVEAGHDVRTALLHFGCRRVARLRAYPSPCADVRREARGVLRGKRGPDRARRRGGLRPSGLYPAEGTTGRAAI
ncbi:hypothetical protein F2981_18185 (plasmid) [Sinorhizobium meliloti]|nr:hypothetical protein [Sinorhizobium meliloti]